MSYLGLGAAPTTETHIWVPPSGSTPGYWRRKPAETTRVTRITYTMSQRGQCIKAGIPSGVEAELCAKRLAQGDKLEDVVADHQKRAGSATARDKRLETLTAECINAGVPEAYLQICIAARQQGYSLDQAAGAALEQATIAARKRKKLILIGAGGVAAVVAFFTIKKKKGRK